MAPGSASLVAAVALVNVDVGGNAAHVGADLVLQNVPVAGCNGQHVRQHIHVAQDVHMVRRARPAPDVNKNVPKSAMPHVLLSLCAAPHAVNQCTR